MNFLQKFENLPIANFPKISKSTKIGLFDFEFLAKIRKIANNSKLCKISKIDENSTLIDFELLYQTLKICPWLISQIDNRLNLI